MPFLNIKIEDVKFLKITSIVITILLFLNLLNTCSTKSLVKDSLSAERQLLDSNSLVISKDLQKFKSQLQTSVEISLVQNSINVQAIVEKKIQYSQLLDTLKKLQQKYDEGK